MSSLSSTHYTSHCWSRTSSNKSVMLIVQAQYGWGPSQVCQGLWNFFDVEGSPLRLVRHLYGLFDSVFPLVCVYVKKTYVCSHLCVLWICFSRLEARVQFAAWYEKTECHTVHFLPYAAAHNLQSRWQRKLTNRLFFTVYVFTVWCGCIQMFSMCTGNCPEKRLSKPYKYKQALRERYIANKHTFIYVY